MAVRRGVGAVGEGCGSRGLGFARDCGGGGEGDGGLVCGDGIFRDREREIDVRLVILVVDDGEEAIRLDTHFAEFFGQIVVEVRVVEGAGFGVDGQLVGVA